MQNADTKLAVIGMSHWRAGCLESLHVRFGRGRMEKDAAGCPSLPSHYGLTNPGTSRTSPVAYLTPKDAGIRGRVMPYRFVRESLADDKSDRLFQAWHAHF